MLKRIVYLLICMVFIIAVTPSALADDDLTKNIIVGFSYTETPMISLHYNIDDKPSEEMLREEFPQNITVKLDTGKYEDIPIEWICASGDYDNTFYGYYAYYPQWDPKYTLSENVNALTDIPYIGVYLDCCDNKLDDDKLHEDGSVTGNINETIILNFLIEELYCNTATAVGILANIKCESSFNPNASCIDTNGLTSYGICQWNGSRYTALQTYCSNNGLDYRTVQGQLKYLKHELTTTEASAWSKMQGIENSVNGAYTAGYNWARYFERCAQYYNGVNQYETRGQLAMNTYWPEYMHMAGWKGISVSNPSIPQQILQGKAFSVTGKVYSDQPIASVKITVEDILGQSYTERSDAPLTTSYDLKTLDKYILFNILPSGVFKYRVKVTTAEKSVYVVDSAFAVLSSGASIADGSYKIVSSDNGTVLANLNRTATMQNSTYSASQVWNIQYADNGYYTVSSYDDSLYLEASGGNGTNGTVIQMGAKSGSSAQRWQILWTGLGFSFLPECGVNKCIYPSANGIVLGASDMTSAQRFMLEKASYGSSITVADVEKMTIEECIAYVNSIELTGDVTVLSEAQMRAIERVLG